MGAPLILPQEFAAGPGDRSLVARRERPHRQPAAGKLQVAAQTDREQATGSDQRRDFAEGPVSLRWRDVLPDSDDFTLKGKPRNGSIDNF